MNRTVQIKPVAIDGVNELRHIAVQAYKDHYLHLWYDGGDWYMEKSFSIQGLSQELSDSNAQFYIIYLGDEAVGFLKLNINAPLEGFPGVNALELKRIYLTKAASGNGVGSTAINFVCNVAAQQHKHTIWLKVMDSSKGPIAFYKKHGFEICGTYLSGFEQMKKELRGMYVMKKEINSENMFLKLGRWAHG